MEISNQAYCLYYTESLKRFSLLISYLSFELLGWLPL
jgi:hypothetical protein